MDKALFVSDIHIPKHDKRMLSMFMQVVKKWKPDSIDLLGDIDDAEETSRWVSDTVDEKPMKESLKAVNEFLADLRKYAPNAEIHLHDGNHGFTRHASYIDKNAKALSGFITPDSLYDLKNLGIIWHSYQEPPVKRFGDLYAHHGIAISKNAGESVRKDMDDMDVSIIRGHSHRQGVYKKTTMRSDLHGYEIGHLCDVPSMTYSQFHNWQAGFAIAHVENDTPFVQLVSIKDYKCVVDGKLIQG